MTTQSTDKKFFVEVEKALDWENGYLNWDNKVVTDIKEAQEFDSKEDAEDAAGHPRRDPHTVTFVTSISVKFWR